MIIGQRNSGKTLSMVIEAYKKYKHYYKVEGHEKVEKVMDEYKHGELKSHGKKVKSRKQAVAIALSEQRKEENL